MDRYRRAQVDVLVGRLAEDPRHLIALSGPRQSGKTAIVLQALEILREEGRESLYVAVDRPGSDMPPVFPDADESALGAPRPLDIRGLVQVWEQARQEAKRRGRGFVLVLDEIQKIPQWSEPVKGLWDADRMADCPLHVVILGPSPLIPRPGLTESLAGRFEPIDVRHWSFGEMSRAFGFDLPRYLYFGGYPGAARFCREPERWREYILGAIIETSIERDIFPMSRVDKPALLRQLLDLGVGYSGQVMSYTKLLRQLRDAGNTTTLARHLDLLGQARLLAGLPKHCGSFLRTRTSSPKLNVLDTALTTAGSGYSFEEAQADRTFWGRLTESAVGAHLFNTMTSNMRLHYWREQSLEVDYVLQCGSRMVAIEVESDRKKASAQGMKAFQEKFESARVVVVGKRGVPINEFLTRPARRWVEDA